MKMFSFLILLISFSYFLSTSAMQWMEDRTYVTQKYEITFLTNNKPPNEICNLSKDYKIAICNAIFNNRAFFTRYSIRLNKTAMFHNTMECESNDLAFYNKKQDMFPCYGRNDPMRTDWNIDDNYQYLYISDGPFLDSVFMYYREPTVDGYEFRLREIMQELMIDFLHEIEFTELDTNLELESLETLSYNRSVRQIEVNYVRLMVNSTFQPEKPVCDLEPDQKIALCAILFEEIKERASYEFQLREELFQGKSVDCRSNNVTYRILKDQPESTQKMFPCYGIGYSNELTSLYISDGYRRKSVLVYENTSDDVYSILLFAENIDFTKIYSESD